MSQHYFFNSTVQTKGILYSFFSQGQSYLWNAIDIFATTENLRQGHSKENAFIFDDDSLYWIGNGDPNGCDNLSFCFKNHYAKILGFELATSLDGTARPAQFAFSSSLDNKTWRNEELYSHIYQPSEKFYFTYQSQVSKCFKLSCILSVGNHKQFDVRSLEIFGEIRPYFWKLNGTCQQKRIKNVNGYLLILFFVQIKG